MNNMGFEYDCAGAIICPIQPPKFGINGQERKQGVLDAHTLRFAPQEMT